MRKINCKGERGFALLLSLLALMLLTAIAAGMVYMSSTEISINSNFKNEETAFFAARAGVEEVRDRMLTSSANTINALLPTTLPTSSAGVLYVLQTGVTSANITTGVGSSADPLADDEFCHDFVIGGMTQVPANVRCTSLPTGYSFQTTASVAPYPLEYQWVRVTLKANNSTAYPVNGAPANSNQVCWNGTSEVTLTAANCAAMTPVANPVYMLTALAVTSSGARRIVQQELAENPATPPPGGMYSTSASCNPPALTIGGGASTGSFNSATEATPSDPPTNQTNTNGNIGANGNVTVNGTSASINGTISTNLTPAVGSCPDGVSKTGNPTMGALVGLASPYTPPIPPAPNPLPPVTSYPIGSSETLPPGAYGNVSITAHSTVTLTGGTVASPSVYTLNSLSLAGNSVLAVTGPVVINLAGVGTATVLDMTGGGFSNTTNIPSDFVINYGGSGSVVMAGGAAAFGVLNAPNAAVSFHGGSNFYGQVIANTIDDHGGTNFYWDQSLNTQPPPNTPLYEISLRELSY